MNFRRVQPSLATKNVKLYIRRANNKLKKVTYKKNVFTNFDHFEDENILSTCCIKKI